MWVIDSTKWAWQGCQPTQEEVTTWLGDNPALYQWMRALITVWQGPKARDSVQTEESLEGTFSGEYLGDRTQQDL